MPNDDLSAPSINRGNNRKLALDGGPSLRSRDWPKWPRADQEVQRNVYDVLHSTRWTQSGESHRGWSYATRFADAFAGYLGMEFGVPCASGSTALSSTLEALGIGPGDEVIIPGQTWVACASAILNTGARPVLADLCPESLCLSTTAVEALVTPRTKAVMAVHWHCARADMPVLAELCSAKKLALIEDTSQAHGAELSGRKAGAFGDVSVFSFQQSKLLTAGEGGICVTNNPELARKIARLRADGRVNLTEMQVSTVTPSSLANSQEESLLGIPGDSYGVNRCMPEFQAAILLAALKRLDAENAHRRELAKSLDKLIRTSGLGAPAQKDRFESKGRTFYRYTIRLEASVFGSVSPLVIARALQHELRLAVRVMDRPLPENMLYRPHTLQSHHVWQQVGVDFDPSTFALPVADAAWESIIALPQHCLLGDNSDLDDIVVALEKVATAIRSDPERFQRES